MSDFSFNGVKASSFGLVVKSKNRPTLPNIRQRYETVIGRDGTLDFSDNTLEDRVIEITCSFYTANVGDFRYNIRRVAAWLFGVDGGKKRLVFDDEPDLFYAARVSNQIDLEQTATHGEFSIYFRCEPYAYGVELPYDAYDMASPTIMYRDLHSTDEYVFSGNLFNGYGFQVNNYGTAAVGPIIRIYNPNGNAISIKLNNPIPDPDETFFISTFPSGVLDMTIDMSNYLCYHEYTGVGGVTVRDNYLHLTSGSWFKLRPGYNNMFLFGFGGAGTVRFDFLPRFY